MGRIVPRRRCGHLIANPVHLDPARRLDDIEALRGMIAARYAKWVNTAVRNKREYAEVVRG